MTTHRGSTSGQQDEPTSGTVRLQDVDAVLTAIPYMLGFAPANCLVVVGLGCERVVVAARVDLPTISELTEASAALHLGLSQLPVDAVILVGYGTADEVDPVLTALTVRSPWLVSEVLRVDDGRRWSLTCPDPTCCPPGQPIVLRDDVAVPLAVTSGSPAASRQDRVADLRPADAATLTAVRAALGSAKAQAPAAAYARLRRARKDRQQRRTAFTAQQAARLLRDVSDWQVRDVCVVWHDDAALHLWLDLLPMAPPRWAAPVATLLAAAAYQRGDGALAVMAIERALDDSPDYTLATLIGQFIACGIPPQTMTEVLREAQSEYPLAAIDG